MVCLYIFYIIPFFDYHWQYLFRIKRSKKAYGIGVTEGFFFDSDFLCLEIYFYEGNKILSVFQFFSNLTIFLIAVVRMLNLSTVIHISRLFILPEMVVRKGR